MIVSIFIALYDHPPPPVCLSGLTGRFTICGGIPGAIRLFMFTVDIYALIRIKMKRRQHVTSQVIPAYYCMLHY